MLRRFSFAVATLPIVCLFSLLNAGAQAPVALPYTMTTIGGLAPVKTAGTQCPGLAAGVVSTDAYGDGCLAINGYFGASGRGGVQVDSFGNVIVADDVNGVIHLINPSTGIMTKLAGLGTTCGGKLDSAGDGCLAATQSLAASERGIGLDPYGNVFLPGYGDKLVRMICRTASPLCTPAQVGYVEAVAGCSTGTGVTGTPGTGLDNTLALKLSAGTCTTSLGEVNTPRGVTADKYGNVYFAETATYRFRVVVGPLTSAYFSGNNPIYAALAAHYSSVAAGYAYTVVNIGGNTVATVKGNPCSETVNSVVYSGTALDTYGDGCPLDFSSVSIASSSYVQGVVADAAGNMIFTDPTHGLRVFFVSAAGTAGAAMNAAIIANNSGVTPQPGFVYMLAGGGATTISSSPTLGTSSNLSDTTIFKVNVSPQGHIYIGASGKVYFFDINTGYIRLLLSSGTTVTAGNYCNGASGQKSLSANSDGCPVSVWNSAVSNAPFANANGLGVAVDAQGNLYMYDTTGTMLVRKVMAQGFAGQTLGTALTQTFQLHLPESASGTVTESTATLTATLDAMSAAAPNCIQNADNSVDCTVAVTDTPTAAGLRSAAAMVSLPAGTWTNQQAVIGLGGTVTGSVLAVDSASSGGTSLPLTTHAIFSSITPNGVAVDGGGNVYTSSGTSILASIGGTSYSLYSSLSGTLNQLAVDQTGNVFFVNSGAATIGELAVTAAGTPSTYAATSISYAPASGTAAPQAVAVDKAGNLYVADYQSGGSSIYRLSLAPNTLQYQTTVATGLQNPVSLAVDASGNVYVADKNAGAVYEYTPAISSGQYTYTQSTKASGLTPVAVAVDPAGDVYVQSSGSVLEIPVSGAETTVLTGLQNPTGLAVDGAGNVYSADSGNTSITQVVRGNVTEDFGTSTSTNFTATLTNVGNQASTGQNTTNGSNTTNFTVTGCNASSNAVGAVAAGTACTLSASLTGSGSTTVNDYITFLPSASTTGELTLTGTLLGMSYPTTSTVGSPTGTLVFDPSATEASFLITVDASTATSAPTGSVNVYVDSTSTYTQYPLTTATSTSATATVALAGLSAGSHTIAVVYPTTGQFTGSGAATTTTSFSIAQASTSVSWTPGATTQQVSQAIGTGVLNATATAGVAGNFVYTAAPSGGSATAIDASTYLPIGVYSLGVTFYPTDSTDFASSTGTVASYTVTQAATTAAVGASTSVVATDGTGNYTSLSAALAALPVTGGTVYLKPGTYTGQNVISYPKVFLRGLGGDQSKVILTGEDGAFKSPFVIPGTGSGNANAGGDQGSSTLDVSKSAYIANNQPTRGSVSYTPAGFYAEYLTIQNTYNTSTTKTTTYNTSSGSCADSGSSQTLQAVYNSGFQCNSQALALWITADQAILNNVNLASQQDTLYAGNQAGSTSCGGACIAARQYIWHGLITGDVDYVFGDAALVFDHTNFFTTWHGTAAGGTATIEAQNKQVQTGSANDYLSGYICNVCTLMSQSTGMTNLYYGRPYGAYSTWIMLNSYVDQVNPLGWMEFSGYTNLPSSTYAEYNTQTYTDPALGTNGYPATLFGGTVTPTGGNSGAGVTGTRETTSANPGTIEASNSIKTQLTAAQAAQYTPVKFLSATVPTQSYTGFTPNWNPVTALATAVNGFAPTGSVSLNSNTQSVTILGRPQTPGAGIIPTGTYTFMDSLNGASSTTLASGSLDASGEAYYTTSSLATGTHSITMVYGGDSNFAGSTSAAFTITVPAAPLIANTTVLTVTNASSTYGSALSGGVTVTSNSGTDTPTGTVTLMSGATALGACTLSSGSCTYSLTGVQAGAQTLTASYSGDTVFSASTSNGVAFNVARVILQVQASNASMIVGGALPSFTYSITGFVGSDTQATAVTGAPSLTTAATGASVGEYPIAIATGTLAATNYTFAFTGGYLFVTSASQAPAVATGDTRTVTEPVFPAVCTQLTATLAPVNDDIPTSVDATITNPDGARIQGALNSCSANNPGQAVELSVDGAGNSAFLTGALSMPSNVTLLVDPGVVVFFSRNVQDYDKVSGTHTCGGISTTLSALSQCRPLIEIPGTSTNVGIMGYGKLDGRGGDTLINALSPYGGFSWWSLSSAANGVGNQLNPRFIQMDTNSSNITLYKITLRNSPLFHVSTTGHVAGFTAWGVKIVTPTNSRNTDGIDPGSVTNATITRSWISDGDDNIAVGASGSAPGNTAANISVINNRFFAGHGESIGSYTSAGANNILFDGNMAAGNAAAGYGSAFNTLSDSNSTAVRIKTANDRGGLVTNIQYSNSCFLDHKADIQFTPYYSSGDSTTNPFPSFTNILMQNLSFVNDVTPAGSGTVEFTGEFNTNLNATNGAPSPVINPLGITLDNVTFPSALASLVNSTTPVETAAVWGNGNYSGGTGQYANLTFGPGAVSSNVVNAWTTLAAISANNDTVTNNILPANTSTVPPSCSWTYIAPELTGPNGLPQTITQGQNAAAVVILTPAVGGAAYPTGTVTLTDALTSSTITATLTGTSDTITIPLNNLTVGTHTFTATYSGDTNYPLSSGQTVYTTTAPYVITVNAGSLGGTSTVLSGVPASIAYGNSFTATATVTGSNPTGSVQFVVNGYTYATAPISSGSASASISLPFSTTAYSITAVYSGDGVNAGSTSTAASILITAASTLTTLQANLTTTTLGHPVSLTANVSALIASAGTPTGTVSFTYTAGGSPVSLGSATLSGGAASVSANLPLGTNSVTASYTASGSFASSVSSALNIIVNSPTIVALSNNPIPLAYTMTTIAGGGSAVPSSGSMLCTGATDKYGDGCQGASTAFSAADDLRAIVADPFGNVYVTDKVAKLVRRIAPNGVITNFAGRVTGTACVPTSTTGCTPTLVSLGTPRGVGTDAAGNIYIADYGSDKIWEVKVSTGLLYLVAGTGTAGTTGDGSPATSAQINTPRGVWGDGVGNIYIAETGGNRIRVVDTAGNIHTFAGDGTVASAGDGGPATSAEINNPQGVITDPNLNVYIADSGGGRIRVVCVTCGTSSPLDYLLQALGKTSTLNTATNGYIYTIAGNGSTSPAYSGTLPTLATNIAMSPQKLAFDNAGNLYISDGTGFIWLLDFHTGYIRAIAKNGTVCGATGTDSYGNGCSATQASFGVGTQGGLGVGVDSLNNVYISDTANLLVRKVITGLVSPSAATGSATALPVQIHFAAGDAQAASNAFAYSSTEWSLGTPACTTNSDTTTDCLLTSTFTPAVPGQRSTPLTVTGSLGNTANLALAGVGLGAGSTLDPATQSTFGANLSVAGLAADTAGNIYATDAASKKLIRFNASDLALGAGAPSATLSAAFTAPGAVAVDSRGHIYVADTSTGLVTKVSSTGAASALPFTFTTPAGLAVDAVNNLYVSDSSTQSVYQINPTTGASHTLALGTLVTPKGLAIDPSGNLLVADPGAPAVYRFNLQTGVRTTVTTSATAPSAVLTDAAGNLLIADAASILAVPASANSASFTVATLAPAALAIDSAGNLYTGSGGSILKLTRTQGYVQFAGASASPQTISLLESGNQPLQLTSVSQTDTADYSLAATASTDCVLSGSVPSTLALGGVCAITASYTPTTFVTTADTATFNGNLVNAALSNPAAVQLVLTGPATAPTATIAINAFSPVSPVYGETVTASATVSGSSITPAGTVVFTVDGSTTSASLTNGVASVQLTGLSAGDHTVSAVYTSSNGFTSATASAVTLTVGKATVTIALSNLSQTYTGSALSATATTTPAGLAVSLTYNGSATAPTAPGSYSVVATINDPNYTGTASGTFVIAQATAVASLASSASPVLVQNAITLSATISSTLGTPTGTVTFLDGVTPLGTGTLTGGVATLTISSLSTGSHSITAAYGGDAIFASANSNTVTQVVEDFAFNVAAGTLSATHGSSAVYSFTVSPVGGSAFPTAIALTVSGLPAGATYSFSPAALTVGEGSTPVALTINIPQTVASGKQNTTQLAVNGSRGSGGSLVSKLAPFSLALVLLPFAGRLRRAGKRLSRSISVLLLLAAGMAAVCGIGACGSGSGFFAHQQKTYTVTITGTSGALSHSSTITLTVTE